MYAHFDAGYSDLRIFGTFPGAHIEAPSMPWALNYISIQCAFTQRPAGMGAGVVNGEEYSIHIAESETDAVNLHGSAGTRRDLIHLSYGDVHGNRVHAVPFLMIGRFGGD
jgi:hypothetical protein